MIVVICDLTTIAVTLQKRRRNKIITKFVLDKYPIKSITRSKNMNLLTKVPADDSSPSFLQNNRLQNAPQPHFSLRHTITTTHQRLQHYCVHLGVVPPIYSVNYRFIAPPTQVYLISLPNRNTHDIISVNTRSVLTYRTGSRHRCLLLTN